MNEKTKNKIITIGFIAILFSFLLANILKKDQAVSISERRKLAQFPTITLENIVNGKTFQEIDKYTVDQFISRDSFRSIKSIWSNYIFRQKDNNGLFLKDGCIYKIEYPLNEKNVQKTSNKIKNIYEKYLNSNMNVYYSLIPDKNYYLEGDHLKIDVDNMQSIMKNILPEMQYIDITDALSLDDYYKTDLHWKQENLGRVVSVLRDKMNLETTSNLDYQTETLGKFYGTYYGQLGIKVEPDVIKILTNDIIENSQVYNYEKTRNESVYNMEKWQTSSDKYDVYLSGATPLLTIENKNGPKGKELLLFRDSFGSSITPLLIENYEKITLIDSRYISTKILDNYINFKNQDVLFLYSTLIVNQNVLKD